MFCGSPPHQRSCSAAAESHPDTPKPSGAGSCPEGSVAPLASVGEAQGPPLPQARARSAPPPAAPEAPGSLPAAVLHPGRAGAGSGAVRARVPAPRSGSIPAAPPLSGTAVPCGIHRRGARRSWQTGPTPWHVRVCCCAQDPSAPPMPPNTAGQRAPELPQPKHGPRGPWGAEPAGARGGAQRVARQDRARTGASAARAGQRTARQARAQSRATPPARRRATGAPLGSTLTRPLDAAQGWGREKPAPRGARRAAGPARPGPVPWPNADARVGPRNRDGAPGQHPDKKSP